MKYVALTILIGSVCQSCANTPTSPETRLAAEARMGIIYECVWYEYLSGDKEQGDLLIDRAIEVAKEGGVPDVEIIPIYSRTHQAQLQTIRPLAHTYAKEARPPKVESIMGNTVVPPTEDEMNLALVNSYRAQCEDRQL